MSLPTGINVPCIDIHIYIRWVLNIYILTYYRLKLIILCEVKAWTQALKVGRG